jgi:hypothetical protein
VTYFSATKSHSRWLDRLRNVLFVAGVVLGAAFVILLLANGSEWGVLAAGWGSAFCLVGSANALAWKYALARRDPYLTHGQVTLRTAVLTVGLACASIGLVAAIIYVYLIVFFTLGSS